MQLRRSLPYRPHAATTKDEARVTDLHRWIEDPAVIKEIEHLHEQGLVDRLDDVSGQASYGVSTQGIVTLKHLLGITAISTSLSQPVRSRVDEAQVVLHRLAIDTANAMTAFIEELAEATKTGRSPRLVDVSVATEKDEKELPAIGAQIRFEVGDGEKSNVLEGVVQRHFGDAFVADFDQGVGPLFITAEQYFASGSEIDPRPHLTVVDDERGYL